MQFNDVDIVCVDGCRQVKLSIRQSITDQLGESVTMLLPETGSAACPVYALSNFLKVRNPNTPQDSQLLFHFNGNPLTRYQFSVVLTKCFRFSNVRNGHYRSHSFPIGAAKEASMRGVPDDKQCGRWKSGAYASYFRFVFFITNSKLCKRKKSCLGHWIINRVLGLQKHLQSSWREAP